jgi:hypothetical protein
MFSVIRCPVSKNTVHQECNVSVPDWCLHIILLVILCAECVCVVAAICVLHLYSDFVLKVVSVV